MRSRLELRVGAAVLALVGSMAACSSDGGSGPAQAETNRPKVARRERARTSGEQKERAPRERSHAGVSDNEASTVDDVDREAPKEKTVDVPKETSALGFVKIIDSPSDAESSDEGPGFAEITSVAVRDLGEQVQLRLNVAEDLPERLERDSFMTIEYTLETDRSRMVVYAEGNESGWSTQFSRGKKGRDLDPGIELKGTRATILVPWSVIGRSRVFTWHADVSWTASSTLRTYFSFDSAPNDQRARFRSRA